MNYEWKFSPEAWRQVNAHVLVSLFKSAVLANKVKVVTTDDNCSLHFHLAHHTG